MLLVPCLSETKDALARCAPAQEGPRGQRQGQRGFQGNGHTRPLPGREDLIPGSGGRREATSADRTMLRGTQAVHTCRFLGMGPARHQPSILSHCKNHKTQYVASAAETTKYTSSVTQPRSWTAHTAQGMASQASCGVQNHCGPDTHRAHAKEEAGALASPPAVAHTSHPSAPTSRPYSLLRVGAEVRGLDNLGERQSPQGSAPPAILFSCPS